MESTRDSLERSAGGRTRCVGRKCLLPPSSVELSVSLSLSSAL